MTENLELPVNVRTLQQRLAEGRIPIQEGLRYAALLADTLRKLHDQGRVHGALTPTAIALNDTGLDLLPAPEGTTPVTPYTAPEAAANAPVDARADIFSFGAVVFEILTGRRAFEEGAAAVPSSGSPAVDRLIAGCVAKDPAARWQRMQKIQLELKLLTAAAHRAAGAPASARRDASLDAGLRAEMQALEGRITAKLQAHAQAAAALEQSTKESVNSLRDQLSSVSASLAAAQEDAAQRFQQSLSAFGARLAALEQSDTSAAISQLELAFTGLRRQVDELHSNMAADMRELEVSIKSQSTAIDSARTAVAQTDDLVERVVEALESLQSAVLEHSEERSVALN